MATIDKKGFIHGRIGNVVYRRLGDVTVVQSVPTKVRQTDATKLRAKEFGLASSAAKVLRQVFSGPATHADSRVVNRLGQAVLKAIRNGEPSAEDLGDLHHGNLSFIEGFQFNPKSTVASVLLEKPVVNLREGGRIAVSILAIEKGNLVFPAYSHSCTMRIMVVAVDFKKEYYQYLGYKDITIKNGKALAAEEWLVDEAAEAGSIVMVSLSLHYFSSDGVSDDGISLNDKSFSPAELIAAMPIGEEGAEEQEADVLPFKNPLAGYQGNEIIRELKRMQAKQAKKK